MDQLLQGGLVNKLLTKITIKARIKEALEEITGDFWRNLQHKRILHTDKG